MSMQVINIIASAFAATGSYMFFTRRSLRYLRYFQQEDYLADRFFGWYRRCKAFDHKGSSVALLTAVTCLFLPEFAILPVSAVGAAMVITIALREENPLSAGKITLKMTARAKRIEILALIIYLAAIFAAAILCHSSYPDYPTPAFWFAQILLFQLQPASLILANWMLSPYEQWKQSGFAREAARKVRDLKPYVIGITGSYGKTSTKLLLGQILSNIAPTFYCPGSINTYMGITREIRARLKPEHKFAVIEMAAYQRGTIAKLCKLTPPDAAIITAVGEMHMERFGSSDQVYQAKSELAQAVPEDGILVVNGDNELCRKMALEHHKKTTLIYGTDETKGPLDAHMYDIEIKEDGSSKFSISWGGKTYQGSTALLGRHMLSNILAAFTMSCALGYKPELILAAVRNIKAESNRLEPARVPIATFAAVTTSLKKPDQARTVPINQKSMQEGSVTRLNDAYNSNPVGFAAALEVLDKFPASGRKVLVTPGMIELGPQQSDHNKNVAKAAAEICDLVVVVGRPNREAIVEGLREGKMMQDDYKAFDSMKEAFVYLGTEFLRNDDVVLIENDLADLYEGMARF
jgi:UDP-N-acetylmuramoyl-tripeptide--D-alanyl-D-alanine ligase